MEEVREKKVFKRPSRTTIALAALFLVIVVVLTVYVCVRYALIDRKHSESLKPVPQPSNQQVPKDPPKESLRPANKQEAGTMLMSLYNESLKTPEQMWSESIQPGGKQLQFAHRHSIAHWYEFACEFEEGASDEEVVKYFANEWKSKKDVRFDLLEDWILESLPKLLAKAMPGSGTVTEKNMLDVWDVTLSALRGVDGATNEIRIRFQVP